MGNPAVQAMNGTIWVFAGILIVWVLVQSFLFWRLVMSFNNKFNLVSKEEISSAIQTGATAAIGPSLNSIVVCLTLIAMVGSATAFMRCGVIGAPGWELLMANTAAATAGVNFEDAGFNEGVFTFAIFCMVLASAPYFINTMITLKPLDMAAAKATESGAKITFTSYMADCAMYGLLSYSLLNNYKGPASIAAIVGAAIGYLCWSKLSEGKKGMGAYSLAVGMLCGMLFGQVCATILG